MSPSTGLTPLLAGCPPEHLHYLEWYSCFLQHSEWPKNYADLCSAPQIGGGPAGVQKLDDGMVPDGGDHLADFEPLALSATRNTVAQIGSKPSFGNKLNVIGPFNARSLSSSFSCDRYLVSTSSRSHMFGLQAVVGFPPPWLFYCLCS